MAFCIVSAYELLLQLYIAQVFRCIFEYVIMKKNETNLRVSREKPVYIYECVYVLRGFLADVFSFYSGIGVGSRCSDD